ncbi:hypothetical protein LTR36_004416 [Oleoguttula mirabilis]|uniref:Uncharacterized protein n=1 Tax=Oleoguttula mirabilis TaxID=1507867 RepID=A0AAV9JGW8_9PEZI|nr:hypothetical protein LTR36_004416 [Oleoguttula mirabilis]
MGGSESKPADLLDHEGEDQDEEQDQNGGEDDGKVQGSTDNSDTTSEQPPAAAQTNNNSAKTADDALNLAYEHLAIAIALLSNDKESAREHETLNEWITGWLGMRYHAEFQPVLATTREILVADAAAFPESTLPAPLRSAREGGRRGIPTRTLAADHAHSASGILGLVDELRAGSLVAVARVIRRQATKKGEKGDKGDKADSGAKGVEEQRAVGGGGGGGEDVGERA